MIITIDELIDKCHYDFEMDLKDVMDIYHLRFEEKGFSVPINHIKIDKSSKAIVLCFKQENILKGIDGDVE